MVKFVVLSCRDSKRSKGNFTLWGKVQKRVGDIVISSPLFWLRSATPKEVRSEIELPDDIRLVKEVVDGREFTHIELSVGM